MSAFYKLTLNAPWPWSQVGFSKDAIRSKSIGIVSCDWDTVNPFCPQCGKHLDRGGLTKDDVIQRLMQALIIRGAKPSDVQDLVGNAVSTIDVLAATYPKLAEG
jgi:hypothetical protein